MHLSQVVDYEVTDVMYLYVIDIYFYFILFVLFHFIFIVFLFFYLEPHISANVMVLMVVICLF